VIYILLSRCASGLSSGLEDLLPRTIFNFDALLQYYRDRIGIDHSNDEIEDDETHSDSHDDTESTSSGELSGRTTPIDAILRMIDGSDEMESERIINLEGIISYGSNSSNSNNSSGISDGLSSGFYPFFDQAYSDLMMSSATLKELQTAVKRKRMSSYYAGPILLNLNEWIERTIRLLSDTSDDGIAIGMRIREKTNGDLGEAIFQEYKKVLF